MNAEMKAENTGITAKYTEMNAENAEMKAESSRRACAQLVWRLNVDWETNCTVSCPVLPAAGTAGAEEEAAPVVVGNTPFPVP